MRPTTQEIASVRRLLEAGVITSRSALLLTLLRSDTGACQVGPLAAILGVSIPRASMLGDTMVKMTLVDRCIPASDMRKVTLALTQRGYAVARNHLNLLRAFTGNAGSAAGSGGAPLLSIEAPEGQIQTPEPR